MSETPGPSPYAGRRAVLATMHGKEAAVAPAFREIAGIGVTGARGIDTDRLGTFTGEVARTGSVEETALAKARLGMAATGETLGIASEGSYGPHPQVPFLAAGVEHLVFVDEERGLVVRETLVDEAPVYDHAVIGSVLELEPVLWRLGFPDHAVTVRPNDGVQVARKGIRERPDLREAVAWAVALSADGRAFLQTDMRAHMNPTRMAAIGRLAARLARRLLQVCPSCRAPGFGAVGVERGLPCALCGEPTGMVRAELHGCAACGYSEARPRPDGRVEAEAGSCPACNP